MGEEPQQEEHEAPFYTDDYQQGRNYRTDTETYTTVEYPASGTAYDIANAPSFDPSTPIPEVAEEGNVIGPVLGIFLF